MPHKDPEEVARYIICVRGLKLLVCEALSY
jgi:hypothetical protein